jgi:hypothetical protein
MCATCPAHLILLDVIALTIWWRMQAMKFIIMLFSSQSVFLLFRSKYPQHPVFKNPQSMFLPQSERPGFAPI